MVNGGKMLSHHHKRFYVYGMLFLYVILVQFHDPEMKMTTSYDWGHNIQCSQKNDLVIMKVTFGPSGCLKRNCHSVPILILRHLKGWIQIRFTVMPAMIFHVKHRFEEVCTQEFTNNIQYNGNGK